MFAVIGLGNPGAKYEATRHNAGFWVVDCLQRRIAAGESWKTKDSCLCIKSALHHGRQGHGQPVLLVKPQKFMNLSGQAIRPLLQFFKVPPEKVVVIHDDLDLPAGRIQVRKGGSAAGHNGVSDIIAQLGNKEFYRIRVGIASGAETEESVVAGRDWVLSAPGPIERELLEKAVTLSADALEMLLLEGLEKAQQQFNRRVV